MKHYFVATAALMAAVALAAVPAFCAEATFERNLTVNGRVELTVATGAGSIHLTRGSAGQIHVFGRVRSSWGGSDEQVRQIAANPPIEQTGNIVRIGARHENLHNISIDYEIQAPADAYLNAASGSGDVTDDGVGENTKLSTGSGSIHATALHGGFSVDTGSGTIYAEQTGDGDVKAETGSGSIELRNLHGGLKAETGSGDIKVGGTPTAPWKLEAGSGSVELWTGNAGLTLDAETGSGSVHTDREMTTQGTEGRHHVMGKINGGGPTVRIETGSGSIRVH
jgi:Putative adhesin